MNLYEYLFRISRIPSRLSFFLYKKVLRRNYVFLGEGKVDILFTQSAQIQGGGENIIIGKKTIIEGILNGDNGRGHISIGELCYIGPNTRIWAFKDVRIGNRVLISHNCNIFDSNCHPINKVERSVDYLNLLKFGYNNINGEVECAPVFIDDDVWIGANSSVMKGVHIGEGSIIGAGSVVIHDVPPNVIVAGNPAQVVKRVDN